MNGSPRQAPTTADMIFPVDCLIWHLSQFMTLEPGDVVNTGTPEGVALSGRFPYLVPGDVMELRDRPAWSAASATLASRNCDPKVRAVHDGTATHAAS